MPFREPLRLVTFHVIVSTVADRKGASCLQKPSISGWSKRLKRTVRKPNAAYRTREYLTEKEMAVLLDTLKTNRHGLRDWLIGLVIYRHGLRVSEACDLRWDNIDFAKRTILVRRLKGSHDSTHFLERDELTGLKRLQREQEPKSAYVFVNERGQPFGRFGIARMIERAGEAAGLPFPVHVHMLRHATGYALAARGMDTRRLQHFLGHASITNTVRYTAMSPEPFKDLWR
jgi:type 1 fimbriae regulatory protein FimB/type 1 fimbriae regulatory protein FimE